MYSLRELYKIGHGPSSSHTMGPAYAVEKFKERYPDCQNAKVILKGSLALTGRGHLTDKVIIDTFYPIPCEVSFDIKSEDIPHPNTMDIYGYNDENTYFMQVYSIGGGSIRIEGEAEELSKEIYPLNKLKDIKEYCNDYKIRFYEYVDMIEDEKFNSYMEDIYNVLYDSVERGLNTRGHLPGNLHIKRKANYLLYQNFKDDLSEIRRHKLVAYAYAVSEENASGGLVVTAPTCGSAGVLPACMRYAIDSGYSKEDIINALKTAGLIGNLVKKNASISGAEAGCQAEIGTACAMSAAFLVELYGGSLSCIESASEIALEHHLGLTCDPVDGYVQIPCIERNAVAALRALDASKLASYLNNDDSKISFDLVVETMLDTGKDLKSLYRETSKGGLAKKFE
ncbi:MAG: L-serine ammonia-lyase, iron-sulfur-dependent, subunit alpha [Anaeroplasmataceae bacterium]